MTRFFIVLTAVLAMAANSQAGDLSSNAVGAETNETEQNSIRLRDLAPPEQLSATPVGHNSHHHHWHFVGCVNSHNECEYHAAEHGYHHHRVKHSHHKCHHDPHLACYGRN